MRTNWTGLFTLIHRELARLQRVKMQALFIPWLTALLYIFIFGSVVGKRIVPISGFSYIDFVLPGILMMNIISSAFNHASYSVYIQRFMRDIEEILVAPLSYLEIIIGYVIAATVRGFVVGMGVYALAVFFSATNLAHFWFFLFFSLGVALLFAFLGMLLGLYAKIFDQLAVVNFFLLPLTFLGGVFNSFGMLPPQIQTLVRFNPFFYFVDGLRFAMIGFHESNVSIGVAVLIVCLLGAGALVWYLFKIGWRIRT